MEIRKIDNPKLYFGDIEHTKPVFEAVNLAFGSEMSFLDVHQHITLPERVYLAEEDNKVVGMSCFNSINVYGNSILFVEGVAITPEAQGRGLFGRFIEQVRQETHPEYLGLKTQNPRMYRALEKMCSEVIPSFNPTSDRTKILQRIVTDRLGLRANPFGIVKGAYGKSLYGENPTHQEVDKFFDYIGVDKANGDSVVCLGKLR